MERTESVSTGGKLAPIELTAEDQQQLSIALGGPERFWMLEESEFLTQSGCPPGELENWLAGDDWTQYNIRAVLAGSEVVGPHPHLLLRNQEHQATGRLFCPTKELLHENARQEGMASLQEYIAGRPWVDSCDEIISQLGAITAACTARELPTSEIKLLWRALWIAIDVLLQVPDRPREHMKRLHASAVAFSLAFQERGSPSPQSKYREARVSSRRALSEKHNPVMDGFPVLVELARKVCSHELATYMAEEVRLDADHFLDMLHMLAHDGADPATVENPPARIRVALTRENRRRKKIIRERSQQATDEEWEAVPGRAEDVESVAIANLDWQIGKRRLALPSDQTQAIEDELDGSDVPEDSGHDAAHQERVRRSLAADRTWGAKLRKSFSYLKKPKA